MRVACVGGGPAGLFFSILASQLDGVSQVTVHERLAAGSTYGWGVVFWGNLLDQLDELDQPTAQAIRAHAFRWQDQVVEVQGRGSARVSGHGYSISRHSLLDILARRAQDLGVDIRYRQEVRDPSELGEADLVIACDGANSATRNRHPDRFGTTIALGANKYVWLGTSRVFGSFTFPVALTDAGWVWAHAYGFDEHRSTFVVETTPDTWRALRFDRMAADATMRRLEEIFADSLEGHRLWPQVGTGEDTRWLQFQMVANRRWHSGNLALMGDAAHTAHFTIGSGTRLALEDAMALAAALRGCDSLSQALELYGRRRRAVLRPTLRSAANSAHWFERLPHYVDQERFVDLLLRRRSGFQGYFPASMFLLLSDAALSVPAVTEPVRRAVARLMSVRA